MPLNLLPVSQVRKELAAILRRLQETGEPVFLTRSGQAEAVLIPVDRYNAMMDLLEDMEDERDSELALRVAEARADYKAGAGHKLDEVVAEMEQDVV